MTDYSLTVFAAIVPVLGGAGAYPPTTHINAMSYRLAVWAGPLAYTARWHDADMLTALSFWHVLILHL